MNQSLSASSQTRIYRIISYLSIISLALIDLMVLANRARRALDDGLVEVILDNIAENNSSNF